MKRCMLESVEPTLYYSYSRKTSLGQWYRRKLLECSIKGSISIVLCDKALPATKSKCAICTLVRESEYTISIGDQKFESNYCCRFCRDRVLSVQDFFEFITCLASNSKLQSQTILTTFKKVMWLRRRMGLSIVGSCSMFENEVSAVVGAVTTNDTWEQNCDIKY